MQLTSNSRILLVLPLLILSTFLAVPMEIPQAHAATTLTGKVCFADPTTAVTTSPCPASPPTFDGPVGQQIRIGVFISNDNGTDGFDITILANSTILRPVGIDFAGTLLKGTPLIVQYCVRGILIKGTTCAATDSVDTIHLVTFSALGQNNTSTPTNGLLFTAIYNITRSITSAITIGFQTGCVPPTSVGPNVCVTIANGTKIPNPETIQTGSFSNSNISTLAYVDFSASQTGFGPEPPNTVTTATITATAKNGYPVLFGPPDLVTFSTSPSPGMTATISGTNPCVTNGVSCSVNVMLSAGAAGNYTVTVYGTYATQDPAGNSDTLVGVLVLTIIVDDFGFTVSPTSLTFNSASTGSATIAFASQNGFAGTVSLSNGLIIPPGLTIAYNPASVVLSASGPGRSATSTATFSAHPTATTTYHATIKATSGTSVKQSPNLTIKVVVGPDFTITANPSSVPPVDIGVHANSTITITAVQGFTGTVNLTNSTGTTALLCSLSPTSVTGSGSSTLSCTGSAAGSYNANITGTSGTLGHSVIVAFTIKNPTPDFNVSANPTTSTVLARAFATSTISVNATHGFTGTVLLTDSVSPSTGLVCTLTNTTIILGSSGTSGLSCGGSQGAYTVTITGSNGPLVHTVQVSVTVEDFGITASPLSVKVNATTSGSSTISITSKQGFSGSVGLDFTLSPNSGLSCTLTPTTIPGGSGSSALSCHGSVGSFQANVTGTSGSLSHSVIVTFTVVDFSLSAAPATITFGAGGSASSTITVSSLQGFSGTVALSLVADAQLTAGLTSTSVPGGSGTSTLTISGSVEGAFTVNVTGTSGPLTHTITVPVSVSATPDFKLTANPATTLTNPNVTASSTITVTALNGFTGTIHLNFTTIAGISCRLGPTSVVLGASGTSTLSCIGQAGIYPVTVWGTNGTATRFALVRVEIQDFTMSASSTFNFNVGGTGAAITVTLTSMFNFEGSISLTSMVNPTTGLVVTCPASTSITKNATVTASCTLTSSTVGTFAVTITGSLSPAPGSIPHSGHSTVHVGDFTVSVPSSDISFNIGASAANVLTLTSTQNFAGGVNVAGPTAGLTVSCTSVTLSSNGTASTCTVSSSTPGTYGLTLTATAATGTASHSVTITILVGDFTISSSNSVNFNVGGTGTITVTLTSTFNFAGSISLSAVVSPTTGLVVTCPTSLSITANATVTPACTLSSTLSGNYTVTMTGNGSPGTASHSAGSMVRVGDFVLTASPPEITVVEGSSSSEAKAFLASENGFSGTITLTGRADVAKGYKGTARPTVSFSVSTLTLTPGQTVTVDVIVTVSNDVLAYPFGINVTATSGVKTQSRAFSLTVPDPTFTINSSPASLVFAPGGTGTSTVTITSMGGLNGTVTLSMTPPSGLTCYLAPLSVSLPKGGTVTTRLSCSGAVGSYDLNIAGTGPTPCCGPISEQGIVHVVGADFSLSSTPNGILVNTNQTGHARISITWTGNYNGAVQFSLAPDKGVTASLDSTTVTGSGITTLNVSSNNEGSYTVVVTGTSGSSTHSIRLTVTVQSTVQKTPPILGLDPTLFYTIIGVVIVAVAASVVWQGRRPKRSR